MIDFDSIDLSRVVLAVLLNFVWQATLVAAVLFLTKALIKPRYVRIQYGLSVIGLFSLIGFPLFSFVYYIVAYDRLPMMAMGGGGIFSDQATKTAIGSGFLLPFDSLFLWFDSARNLWLGFWMIGAAILSARTAIGLVACHQVRKYTTPISKDAMHVVARIRNRLGVRAKVTVMASTRITQAVATGILKPMVLLPASWLTEMPIASLESVIAHELAHIKRYDLWLVAIQRCVESVFFFHPATWWISRRLTQEREVCCDRMAIEATGNRLHYAETLAMIANQNHLMNQSLTFCSAFSGDQKMNLLRRITLVLEPTDPSHPVTLRPFATIACLSLVVAFGSYSYNLSASPAPGTIGEIQDDDGDQDRTKKKSRKVQVIQKKNTANSNQSVKKIGKGIYRIQLNDGAAEGVYELRLSDDDLDSKNNIKIEKLHISGADDTDAAHGAHRIYKIREDADDTDGIWVVRNEDGDHAVKRYAIVKGDLHQKKDGIHSWHVDLDGDKKHAAGAGMWLKLQAIEEDGNLELHVVPEDHESELHLEVEGGKGVNKIMSWRPKIQVKGDKTLKSKPHVLHGNKHQNTFLFKEKVEGDVEVELKMLQDNKVVRLPKSKIVKGDFVFEDHADKKLERVRLQPSKSKEKPDVKKQERRFKLQKSQNSKDLWFAAEDQKKASTESELAELLKEIKKLRREVNQLKKEARSDSDK